MTNEEQERDTTLRIAVAGAMQPIIDRSPEDRIVPDVLAVSMVLLSYVADQAPEGRIPFLTRIGLGLPGLPPANMTLVQS